VAQRRLIAAAAGPLPARCRPEGLVCEIGGPLGATAIAAAAVLLQPDAGRGLDVGLMCELGAPGAAAGSQWCRRRRAVKVALDVGTGRKLGGNRAGGGRFGAGLAHEFGEPAAPSTSCSFVPIESLPRAGPYSGPYFSVVP
jgi:hypothetical protein